MTTCPQPQVDSELVKLGYEPQLNRSLTMRSLLVYGLLFFVPMAPVAVFGYVVNISRGVPVLVYLVAAIIMGLSAWSYREMALRFPVAGSVYGYVRLATGPQVGFLAGWLILLDYVLMPALLTVLGAISLAHIWTNINVMVFAVLFVLVSMVLNLLGIKVTTNVGLVLLAIQLVVISMVLFFVVKAVVAGEVALSWAPLWRAGTTPGAVLSAVSIAALSYLGFDAVATLNEEARDGGKAVAKATTILLALITGIFALQVYAAGIVTGVVGFPEGKSTSRAFYGAVDTVAPSWFAPIFTLTNAFVAIFACLVVAHASTARLLFAMGRDRVLPSWLGKTTKSGVPHIATIVVSVVAIVVSVLFVEHADLMTSLVTFGALSSYVLLHGALIWRCLKVEGTRRWWAHGVIPVLGATALIVALAKTPSLARTVGLCWLVFGGVVFLVTFFIQSNKSKTGFAGAVPKE